jgi:5-formyltetrahydrofolate cyclo-ligase
MTVVEEKTALRKWHLAGLREISPLQRAEWSQQIVARILTLENWRSAQAVMVYAPMSNEPDLTALFDLGKRLIFPKVTPHGLALYAVSAATHFVRVHGRLWEPDVPLCVEVAEAEVDLALIPALAYARQTGIRLGRGGGYYDRLLGHASFRAQAVGVCFQSQVVPRLPQEPHDLAVSAILTERERIDLKSNSSFLSP